jgi:release factor glutamine methyltransferase
VLRAARSKLATAGVINATAEAEWLLEAASGTARNELVARDPDVEPSVESAFGALVSRRMTGEPLQYVTGVAGFRHLELAVGPGVFIPRPETELVAALAMERLPANGTVVDVGTGSGAMALAIAQERPDARVLATEVSPDALAWATMNRDALGLDVEVHQGDLLGCLPRDLAGLIDVVVANMPYVPTEEASFLPGDVVRHEPHVALFGDAGGLALVERVAAAARDWLLPGGWLVLEIGDRQGGRVVSVLEDLGYVDVTIRLDYAERERIAEARLPRESTISPRQLGCSPQARPA